MAERTRGEPIPAGDPLAPRGVRLALWSAGAAIVGLALYLWAARGTAALLDLAGGIGSLICF